MDVEMSNLAVVIAIELRAMMKPGIQLYRSGNMKSSVSVVAVDDNYVDIVIATDYASYTNTRGRMAGWIEQVVDRCCRSFSQNNVDNESIMGTIYYGV